MLRWNRLALTLVLAAASLFVALPTPAEASPNPPAWTYFAYEDADGHGQLAYRLFHDPHVLPYKGIEVVIWQNGYTFKAKGIAGAASGNWDECGFFKFRVDFVKYVGNGHYAKFPFWGTLPLNSLCKGSGWYYDLDGKNHWWKVFPLEYHIQ